MYNLTESEIYNVYANKWEKYQNSGLNRKRAFIRKAIQKIFSE
jgi:hypothetical protein